MRLDEGCIEPMLGHDEKAVEYPTNRNGNH